MQTLGRQQERAKALPETGLLEGSLQRSPLFQLGGLLLCALGDDLRAMVMVAMVPVSPSPMVAMVPVSPSPSAARVFPEAGWFLLFPLTRIGILCFL